MSGRLAGPPIPSCGRSRPPSTLRPRLLRRLGREDEALEAAWGEYRAKKLEMTSSATGRSVS